MTVKTRGVAFVITVYNKERYLEGTLKSILAQEGGFDREIIVVDDGSTDRSRKIAEGMIGGLANGKIIQQINSDPGVAQNTGVAAASMAVIKFVDGDDLLPPDCVLRMLPELDLPNVAMVHGDDRLLNKLDDDDFLALRKACGLAVAYAQLLSMNQLTVLERLGELRGQNLAPQAANSKATNLTGFSLLEENGSLVFD